MNNEETVGDRMKYMDSNWHVIADGEVKTRTRCGHDIKGRRVAANRNHVPKDTSAICMECLV